MKKVILCPNPYRDKGLAAAREADAILKSAGLTTVYCLPFKPEGGEAQFGVPCQASMEERMACGVGACLGCAVAMKDKTVKHVCKDGPVFDAQEGDWDA